jgi:hypothetical protein
MTNTLQLLPPQPLAEKKDIRQLRSKPRVSVQIFIRMRTCPGAWNASLAFQGAKLGDEWSVGAAS